MTRVINITSSSHLTEQNYSAPKWRRLVKLSLILVTLAGATVWAFLLFTHYRSQTKLQNTTQLGFIDYKELISNDVTTIAPTDTWTYQLAENNELISPLPKFAKLDKGILTATPAKYDVGTYFLVTKDKTQNNKRHIKTLQVALSDVNVEQMKAEIMSSLGANANNFGIYIQDLQRDQVLFDLNAEEIFPPGSISKLPVALLTLRDLDSGKLTPETTYPVSNKYKHSRSDGIGALAEGTKVRVDTYLRELLRNSNNTAQYHLREMLGSTGVMYERTQAELEAITLAEDPHVAKPKDVARLWVNVYTGKVLSEKWKNYFLDNLNQAAPGLREAIVAGLPKDVWAATKVGFLFGGKDNVYNDSGIVKGKYTDYVIAVFNRKAPAFPTGSRKIADISRIVYKYLDVK